MQGRDRKTRKKEKSPSVSSSSGERKRKMTERKAEKSPPSLSAEPKATLAQEENAPSGLVTGKPSFIQSTYGMAGNFELVVPLAEGGLAYFWRNNDDERLPWEGPVKFAAEAGRLAGVSLIQGDFGEAGNLELVATDLGGHRLMHFWRDSGSALGWYGPTQISEKSLVPIFSGSPAMIRSNFGCRGNFDLVVPLAEGGFSYYWRDNDDPHLHWYGPFMFGMNLGPVAGVSLIQSNFGSPGHLELVAQIEGHLAFFWRDSGPDFRWNGPQYLTL
ncbi:Uncharacterised protein [uncultured archaeon]|nr:Uncharacterised protein [uncultured archaeon]